MTERHIMIDLETVSTRTTAALASIGAYVFEPNGDDSPGPDDSRMFHCPVRISDSIEAGLHVDGDTIGWWLLQSLEARTAFAAQESAASLEEALSAFSAWALRGGATPADVVIWSHAGFDFPILANAYDVMKPAGVVPPFWYWSPRDMRTIIHAAYGRNLDVEDEEPGFPANLMQHHAGYDAWHQAVAVQYCFRRLARVGEPV